MKLRLTLDNIGGISLVPYSGNQPVLFGVGDLSVNSDLGYAQLVGHNVLIPETRDPTKPILTLDQKIYLAGATVTNDAGTELLSGGYLDLVTVTLTAEYDNYDEWEREQIVENCSLSCLGVVPAEFSGGLSVDNLHFSETPMLLTDYGTILHPTVQDPNGGRVGKTRFQDSPLEYFCYANRIHISPYPTPLDWRQNFVLQNQVYEKYALGNRSDNMTVNFDGEYVPAVLGSMKVKGVISNKDGSITYNLSQHHKFKEEQT